jgi:protein SCO1/2
MYQTVSSKIKIAAFILLFLAGCTTKQVTKLRLPFYNKPDFTPQFLNSKDEINKQITHTIGDFEFIDQHGKSITQKDIEGKIHVANFIFTSCGSICPFMIKHLKLLQK